MKGSVFVLFIVQKNPDETLSIADPELLSPFFLLVEEEFSYYKEDDKDCIEITSIFDDSSLDETVSFFHSESIRNLLVPSNRQITVCTVIIKKKFYRGLKNIFDSCSRQIESQSYVKITNYYLSSTDNKIKKFDVCLNSTLDIFEKTSSLSSYSNKIHELLNKF